MPNLLDTHASEIVVIKSVNYILEKSIEDTDCNLWPDMVVATSQWNDHGCFMQIKPARKREANRASRFLGLTVSP